MLEPLIIAHRGASSKAVENTRAAFRKALAQGADGIETDIQLSSDDIPVLWHDDDLARIGRPGQRIDQFSFAELQTLDVGGGSASQQPGESLPSLADFLREFAPLTRLLLEIKQRDDEPTERRRAKVRLGLELARPFRQTGPGIALLSFDLASLIHAHELDPEWPCVLNAEHIRSVDTVRELFVEYPFLAGLSMPIGYLDQTLANAVRRTGKCLAVYTCNSEAEIRHALALRVDWLMSDKPGYARSLRET